MDLCLEDMEEAVSADLLPSLGTLEHCPSSMAKSTCFRRHIDGICWSWRASQDEDFGSRNLDHVDRRLEVRNTRA